MPLTTTAKERPERVTEVRRTMKSATDLNRSFSWWTAKEPKQRGEQLVSTVSFLKKGQQSRQRQAAIFARLYGGQAAMNFIGTSMSRVDPVTPLAPNRPTYNLVSSVCDTIVSRLTQSRPAPTFLTDNGNYKARFMAKRMTNFVAGEFYRAGAYQKGAMCLLDGLVEGTGIIKIVETPDHKVGLERVLCTELYVDLEEAAFGDPRRIYQLKVYDREVLASMFKDKEALIMQSERASIDGGVTAGKSTSDLVMVVEGWSLPSGDDTGDGYHSIACSEGELLGEKWEKSKFPFVFFHHHKRMLGFWSQGVAEALMGTQLEINSLLDVISKAIRLVGVPRVFYEEGSKVNKANFSNKIGVMVPYKGTPPIVSVSQCVPEEMYRERDRLIQYGYQQEGLSFMEATAQKPAGLNSGEAIRSFDDISTDRFASTARSYDQVYVDLAYAMIDKAIDIAKEQGKYTTVYPGKKGTETLDLPKVAQLKDPFVIQCFNESSLPRDPAGRKQTISEHVQAGMLTIQEGRRLLNFPDLEQIDTLAVAAEERIFAYLDDIIDDGTYNPPDPFMNLDLAKELVVQYINLYLPRKLEADKAELLRMFHQQAMLLEQQAASGAGPGMPGAPGAGGPSPIAPPQPLQPSPLVPQVPAAAA